MRLTDSGRNGGDVRASFEALSAAVRRLRERHAGHGLTVSVLPSFAAAWLMDRLGDFLTRNPHIEFNLQSSRALADFGADGVDVAIRYGEGPWPGLVSERILDDEIFPVCSPQFRQGRLPRAPDELAGLLLLRLKSNEWEHWFAALGIEAAVVRPGVRRHRLSLQAAIRGQGIALARRSLIADKLAQRRPRRTVRAARAGLLRVPSRASAAGRLRESVACFRAWLLEQIAADRAHPAGTDP